MIIKFYSFQWMIAIYTWNINYNYSTLIISLWKSPWAKQGNHTTSINDSNIRFEFITDVVATIIFQPKGWKILTLQYNHVEFKHVVNFK